MAEVRKKLTAEPHKDDRVYLVGPYQALEPQFLPLQMRTYDNLNRNKGFTMLDLMAIGTGAKVLNNTLLII